VTVNLQVHAKGRTGWLLSLCLTRRAPIIFHSGGERGLVAVADPEAIYNLCLILKIMLQKLCLKHNSYLLLFALAFVQIQIYLHVP
jgi:hypothetical protein